MYKSVVIGRRRRRERNWKFLLISLALTLLESLGSEDIYLKYLISAPLIPFLFLYSQFSRATMGSEWNFYWLSPTSAFFFAFGRRLISKNTQPSKINNFSWCGTERAVLRVVVALLPFISSFSFLVDNNTTSRVLIHTLANLSIQYRYICGGRALLRSVLCLGCLSWQ